MQDDHEAGPSRATVVAINFVADAGKQMLESSSSVSEVEQRLRRLLPVLGLDGCSLDATMSSLILCYSTVDQPLPITVMRDLHVSSPLLERLTETELLLDELERGGIDVNGAATQLRDLAGRPGPRTRSTRAALLVSVLGWVLFLDGLTLLTVAVAVFATVLTLPIDAIVRRLRLPALFGMFLAAVIVAAIPNLIAAAGASLLVGPAVVGALYVYLPGRALVSAVIDGLSNAPMSSISRGLQAVVTAGALALGMLAGSKVGFGLGLNYRPDVNATPLGWSILGAAVGVFGLAVAWAMPRQRLLPTVAIGAAGWILLALTSRSGDGSDWLWYGLAAALVGVAGSVLAILQGGAASVYVGVAILPLVPGFTLYTGVLDVAQGKSAAALSAFGDAGIISLAIAVGAAVGLALSRDMIGIAGRLNAARRR